MSNPQGLSRIVICNSCIACGNLVLAKAHKSTSDTTLIQNVSRLLTSCVTTAEGIEKVADLLAKHTQAEAVQISALISEGDRVVEIYSHGNLSNLFPSGLRRPSNGASMRTISNRGPLSYDREEMLEVSHHGVEDFSVFLAAGYNHLVAVPITLNTENLGAIQLLSSQQFDEGVQETLVQVAPILAPHVALFLSGIESAAEDRISSAIERVAEAVIQENAIEGVCDAVVKFATSSMGIDAAILRVVDSDSETLRIEYKYGHLDPVEIAGEAFPVVEERLIPFARDCGRAMIVDEGSPEVFNDPEILPLIEEIPSMLVTPLFEKDQLLGTLEFYSLNEYAYKSDHLRNVEYVANLLTSAVEHFRLVRSLSREAEIRSALAEVARLAGAAPDLTSLVESISPELRKIIPIDRVTYYMPPERFHTTAVSELFEEDDRDPVPSRAGPPFIEPTDSRDGLARIVVLGPDETVCKGASSDSEPECRAAYCVAARLWDDADDRPQGWIHLERSDAPFTAEERDLAPEFARHISPAINTALLHESELQLAQEHLRAERAEAEVKNQQELNEAKQNFIATMSHELRTPLTSIRAFTDLLNRDSEKLTDRQRRQVAVVRRNAEWLSILINDLLDLSSIDSGRFELQFEKVDVISLLEGLAESFGPIAEISGHELNVILPKRPVIMTIDPNRVGQVVGNLLNNAMKYSPEGTPIRLLARPGRSGVFIYIRDEGLGIPKRQQALVFERFVRAKSEASSRARGTGIGLYVSRMIVESHKGKIGVSSQLKSHTTMHFWLPYEPPGELRGSGEGKMRDAA